jgi:hypothetical protein
MADYLAMPVSFEQIVAVIRQMSSADRQRLLDLVPELRQATQPVTRSSYQTRPGPKASPASTSRSDATSGEYDENAGPGQRPKSSGPAGNALDVGTDWMADLSHSSWREP